MKQGIAHLISLGVLSCTVLFVNLGSARLWDRDEPRNAGCALEMMERDDWVTPIFNDELRDAKPALLYWLIISAYWVFGVTEFAARFWSAILAIGSILLTYGMGRRLFSPQAGFWSACALMSSLMFVVAGRAATPDSVLIFCVTASLAFYVYGTFRPVQARSLVLGAASSDEPSGDSKDQSRGTRRSLPRSNSRQAGSLRPEPGTDELRSSHPQHSDWSREGAAVFQEGHSFPTRVIPILGMYGMMGLGMLAKGPIGVILPMAIIGMFMLIARLPRANETKLAELGFMGRLLVRVSRPFHPWHFLKTLWAMRPLTAILIVLAVAGPWFVWVGMRTDGDFLMGFFLREHFGRATTSFENHSGPFYYYIFAILAGFFPWSVFTVPVLIFIDQVLAGRSLKREASASSPETPPRVNPLRLPLVFACCWVAVWVGIFSIAETKLPSYVTPSYPGLALLVGAFFTSSQLRVSGLIQWWNRWAFATLILAGLALGVGLPLAAQRFLPGLEWLGVVGVIPVFSGLVGGYCFWKQQWGWGRASVTMSAVALVIVSFGFITTAIDRFQTNDQIYVAIESHQASDEVRVASVGLMDSTWVYYLRRPVYELTMGPADAHLSSEEIESAKDQRKSPWHRKPRPSVQAFMAAYPDALVITTEEHLPQIESQLPADYEVLERTPHFLQDQTLVLMGRRQASAGERTATNPGDEASSGVRR